MKSIRCSNLRLNGSSFLFVILACISLIYGSPPCGLYGAPPCQFLPAPPGQTPTCARPGKTYCEHVDNYPTYLIKHLVHKWGYEAKNLLIDETYDDFAAVAWHETPVFYDPVTIFPQRNNYGSNGPDFNGYKYDNPSTTSPYNNNRYLNNNNGGSSNSNNYLLQNKNYQQKQATDAPNYLLYSSAGQRLNLNRHHLNNEGISSSSSGSKTNPYFSSSNTLNVTPNSPTLWLKRLVRDLSETISPTNITLNKKITSGKRLTRDVSLNMDLLDIIGIENKTKSRTKRQSPGRSTLCPTNSHFITPQAALNSRGNWMFVVNEANTARQMVKAELCSSNTCSNLCELPIGYNSRCEQKFVQKRLIALQGNGQNLYTDTFWFPSCCVCTISAT